MASALAEAPAIEESNARPGHNMVYFYLYCRLPNVTMDKEALRELLLWRYYGVMDHQDDDETLYHVCSVGVGSPVSEGSISLFALLVHIPCLAVIFVGRGVDPDASKRCHCYQKVGEHFQKIVVILEVVSLLLLKALFPKSICFLPLKYPIDESTQSAQDQSRSQTCR